MRAQTFYSLLALFAAPMLSVTAIDMAELRGQRPPQVSAGVPEPRMAKLPSAQEAERMAHQTHLRDPAGADAAGANQPWEVVHMREEHHLDSYDDDFFFKTHDMDRTGFWTPQDIAALYGISGGFEQEEPIPGGEAKVAEITNEVMKLLDLNGNGRVELAEWLKFKHDGGQLKSYGFAGHHEDFETAFDLHHVEKYHANDPEGSEETWNHKEDIEHFQKHDKIFHAHESTDPLENIPVKFRKAGL